MKKRINRFRYFILLGIILLGFVLRVNNLYTWPRLGATFDEYAWTWLGINLIQHHVPISWSPHPQYQDAKDIMYQHTHFRIVKPYLEHPPLFGLIAGSWALASGVKDMYHVDIQHIRSLALVLGLLSIVFLYLFVSEVYSVELGLLSSFLYAIIPTIAVGSRLVQNENFFIPFFLLSLFLSAKYIRKKRVWLRNSAAIICGLLTLAKVPWIAAAISIIVIFVYLKKYRDALWFAAIVIPIFLLFFAYGFYFDSKLFLSLWGLQLNRYDLAFNSFFALFTSPFVVDREYISGWIYFGWFAVVLLFAKDLKKNFWIVFPFLVYFGIFVAGIPNEPQHGWYRYPFYPFLVVSVALFLKEYFNKNFLLTFFFLLFIGLSMLGLSWTQAFGFSYIVFRFFIILFSLSLLPVFFPKTKKFSTAISYSSGIIIILLTIWSVFSYNEQ